jgi:hypothetical protein
MGKLAATPEDSVTHLTGAGQLHDGALAFYGRVSGRAEPAHGGGNLVIAGIGREFQPEAGPELEQCKDARPEHAPAQFGQACSAMPDMMPCHARQVTGMSA